MYYTALLGHPVDHSVSPWLFGALAATLPLEYGHLKIDVGSEDRLAEVLQALRMLGFRGANITLPYKLAITRYCSFLDENARRTRAVNTIAFRADGIAGYNTDSIAALQSIQTYLKAVKESDKVLVLGAGGAARAIVSAVYQLCDDVTVLNIDPSSAESLSRDLSSAQKRAIRWGELTDRSVLEALIEATIVIQATSVGMYPGINDRIIPYEVLALAASASDFERKCFFDAIFNPYRTHLLLDASSLGARVCSGTSMMIFQAIQSFQIWTGYSVEGVNVDALHDQFEKLVAHIDEPVCGCGHNCVQEE